MDPSLDSAESGLGKLDVKNGDDSTEDCATSAICSTNVSSNDDENQHTERARESRSWLLPFFINIFLARASLSIVTSSLTSYLLDIGAPLEFLPWVVCGFSIGEVFGSLVMGYFYEYTTKTCVAIGRGPQLSLLSCIILGIVGSVAYSAASWIENNDVAKYCLLAARLLSGLWTGGQQAIEQAYLSAAVDPSKRVKYTATLSICAVLGQLSGPIINALLSQIDTTIFGVRVGDNNSAGVFMIVGTLFMFIQTALFFDGKQDRTGVEYENEGKDGDNETSRRKRIEDLTFNYVGVLMCITIFYVHSYTIAVQETVAAPMVMFLYRWDSLDIDSLFMASCVISLITAFSLRHLARYIRDRLLLIASISIGLLGSALLVDKPFSPTLPVWRFLLGSSLNTVAFSLGRNTVLVIFSKVLGELNQGRWMGIIFAAGAFPRVISPFVSLELLKTVDWQTWLEFGICSGLFGLTLCVTWKNKDDLVPHANFAKALMEEFDKARRNKRESNEPLEAYITS